MGNILNMISNLGSSFIDALTPYLTGVVITKYVCMAALMILLGYIIYIMPFDDIKSSMKSRNTRNLEKLRASMTNSKLNAFNYDKIQLFIVSHGVAYFSKGKINALNYVMLKMLCAVFIGIIGVSLNIFLALPFAILGFFLLDIMFTQMDRSDNNDMALDIKNMYDGLRIQTKAGVYLTESLSECYLIVKNSRLKKALLQLTSEIISQSDIIMAVEDFNSKFNNRYIDEFCVIMKQSLESGRTVKLLDDISAQLADMQIAINLKEKEKLQRKIMYGQLLLYGGVLAIAVVAVIEQLANSLASF